MNKLITYRQHGKFIHQRFSTLKQFIKKRQQLNSTIDNIKFYDFCSQLIKVYMFDRVSNQLIKKTEKRFHRMALLDPQPKVSILKYYLKQTRRGFDDDLIATIFDLLGRIQKVHQQDHYTLKGNHKYGDELFNEPLFRDLIDQVKYGLQEGVYFSNKNLAKLLESFIRLNFVDEELIELIFEKMIRKMKKQDDEFKMDIKQQRKYHQMQKYHYYFDGEPIEKKKLLQNAQFNQILELILKNHHKRQKTKKEKATLKGITTQSFGEQASSISELVLTLSQQLNSSKENFESYTDAVLAIRQKYLILCKSQSERQILSDPNLNLQLLELEETLLELKLITIQQVKNLSLLQDVEYNRNQVQKIIRDKLRNQHEDVVSFIQKIVTQNLNNNDNIKVKSNQDEQFKYLGLCLTKLGTLAQLTVNSQQKNDFLSDGKWRKSIKQAIGDEKVFYIDRIFKTIFMKVQQKLDQYLPLLQQKYLKKSNAKSSVFFLNALTRLGRHESALNLFKNLEFQKIQQYSLQQLFQLIEALNNVGEYLSSQKLTQDIINRLKNFVDNGSYFNVSKHFTTVSHFTMRVYQQATVINWLQNLGLNNNDLYINLKNKLKQYTDQIQNPLAQKQFGYAADIFRSQDKYYLTLLDRDNPYFIKNNINPIHTIVMEKLKNYSQNIKIDENSIIKLGFFDLKTQTPNIVAVLPTQFTSLSGKFVDGNMRAYLKRIAIHNNVNVQTINIGSLLNFHFATEYIELKNRQQLKNVFQIFLNRQQGPVYQLSKQLLESLALKYESNNLNNRDIKAIRKITNSIQNILKLNRNQRFQDIHEIAILMRHKVRYGLIFLLKDLTLLSEKVYNQIANQNFINKFNQLIVQLGQGIKTLPIQTNSQFEFIGKRQTVQTLGESKNQNLNFEFIDLHTYHSKQYCQYPFWAQKLKSSLGEFNLATIHPENASLLTKIFLNGLTANKNEYLSVGPSSGIRNLALSPHPLHWDNIYKYRKVEQTNEALQVQRIARTEVKSSKDVDMIVGLQNFKEQLKTRQFSYLNELLTRFNFIEDLIQNHLNINANNSNKIQLIPRDASDYFTYLEQKSKNYLLNSPFVNYMLGKIEKKQKLKNLIELRQRKKIEWNVLVKQNRLPYNQYIELKKQLQKQIINQLESYKKDLIQQRLSILSTPSLKMFKTQINELEFSNFVNRLDFYDREDDDDVILQNGDFEQALIVKRRKAEEKLIKLRLSYKLHNKLQLSTRQKKYLQYWKSSVQNFETQQRIDKNFTQLRISQLSTSDKNILNEFTYSRLNQIDLPLTQLILELSLLFDETALKTIESRLSQNYLMKKYGLSQSLFEIGNNKESSYYLGQLEKRKFDEHNKFSQEQLNHIIEATKLMKIENPIDRSNYNHIYANLVQDLQQINQISNRTQILTSWYLLKQQQFDNSFKPDLITDFKKIETKKIWSKLLGKTYQQCTSDDLKGFIHSLTQRLYLIKRHPPVYFTQLVIHLLTHPKINVIDQRVLIGTIQILKMDIGLDSEDVKILAKHFDNKVLPENELLTRIQQASNKDYSRQILSEMIKL